ncbi:unnamed protein product [Pylaiella littoralis]
MFGCYWKTISRLWRRYNNQRNSGVISPDMTNFHKRSGQKGIDKQALRDKLVTVPIENRTTLRGLAAALSNPQSTLSVNLKALGIKGSRQYLKPLLTDEGKRNRLDWALSFVREMPGGRYKFNALTDMVCVDERWFYLCVHGQKYYLYDEETMPIRRVQHKSHIVKVMFIAAVARPRWNPTANSQFSGLIGI